MRFSLIAFVVASSGLAVDPQFDARHFIEYQPGTLPLIIGSPHGGALRPEEIKDRSAGVRESDANTQELARLLHQKLIAKTGAAPHLIVSLLHRRKLDPNREVLEAAQQDPIAQQAWQDYHGFIERASTAVRAQFPCGLYLDIHGHSHPERRVELGYMIAPEMLRRSDYHLGQAILAIRTSSIRELDTRSPASFIDLLRGPQSLGALLQAQGYPSVPSPAVPAPKEGELYFRGGYTVDRHGSHDGRTLSAIQIECPRVGIRDTAANRERFADALIAVLPHYFTTHFGIELAAPKPKAKLP
jgi:N-formylglutamate amidohydrolase